MHPLKDRARSKGRGDDRKGESPGRAHQRLPDARACHVWDTIGAAAAGWQAALILREGNAPLDVGPQPDYIGEDLDVIAGQLIERYAAPANIS